MKQKKQTATTPKSPTEQDKTSEVFANQNSANQNSATQNNQNSATQNNQNSANQNNQSSQMPKPPIDYDKPIPPKGDSKERDFSNPHHLGFMRFLLFLVIAEVIISLGNLMSLSKGETNLSAEHAFSLVTLLCDAVTFWLIWRRKKYTRTIVITMYLIVIACITIIGLGTGEYDISDCIGHSVLNIIVIIYFATSRRAKAVLVQPWSKDVRDHDLKDEAQLFRPKEFSYWRNLAIYFCVFSVVGHWMEAGYCMLIRFGIIPGVYDPNSQIWSDWLYPFMVYGVGFVVCALAFFPLKNALQKKIKTPFVALIVVYLVSCIVCSGIELAMGLVLNQPLPDGSLPLWDYRTIPFNFMGQICLVNSLAFGLAATFITWIVYPILESQLVRINKDIMKIISLVVFLGFAFLLALYYINLS